MGLAIALVIIAAMVGIAAGKAARPETQNVLPPPPPPPPAPGHEGGSGLTPPSPNVSNQDLTINVAFTGDWFERLAGTGQMRDAATRFINDTVAKMNRQWHALGAFTLQSMGVGTTDFGWNVQVILHYRGVPLLASAIKGFIEHEVRALPQVAPRLRTVNIV